MASAATRRGIAGNRKGRNMKRKQFTFYASFFEAMSEMNMTARGKAVTLLCEFALQGTVPEPQKGALKIYWDLVYPNLAASRKKALAGQFGAGVTNRIRNGKTEKEIENENEIEHKCVSGDGFETFWELYPVKIAREEAYAVWQRKQPDIQTVLKSLKLWMRSKRWTKDAGEFIPRAAKFLEQEYYLQTPEGPVPKGASGNLGEAELEAIARMMED